MKSLGDLLKDERVCARLDEIADMYQDYVNVYKRYNMERLVPLDNGRVDMRRYLMISGEEKYLLIEKDIDHCNEMSLQYSYLGDIAGTDIIMPKILHKNCQKNFEGKECSFLVFTYVEGEPLKEYLKKSDSVDTYNLGIQAGEALKKLHSVQVKWPCMPWWTRHGWTHDRFVRDYQPAPEFDKAFECYKDSAVLMDGRSSSFLNYNVTMDNFFVCNGKIGFEDFSDIFKGDGYYEFRFCAQMALENADFVNGMINGYFDNNVPDNFFPLLRYYTCELILDDLRKIGDVETVEKISEAYDGFELTVPKWYKSGIN